MLKMFKTKYGKKKESKCQDICQKKMESYSKNMNQ